MLFRSYSFAISFAQLKHITNPPVTAIEKNNSYIVNGILTYVTGYKIFNTLVIAFACGDKEMFAITPFCESESLSIVETLNLVTANSSNTVACKLVNHVIDKSMVIIENNLGTFMNNNPKRLRNLVGFSAGLAAATLNLISEHPSLEIAKVRDTYDWLIQHLLQLENALLQLPNTLSVVPLRVKMINLLNKIFLFAEQLVKSQGTLDNHPLAIIRKESIIITASASSVDTLIETCELLSSS